MTAFSFSARLHLDVSSSRALSLPQSSPQKLKGLTAPSSEGAEAAPPQSTDLALLSKFGVNAVTGRRYNPSVFSACETSRKASSPYTGEPRTLTTAALQRRGEGAPAPCIQSPLWHSHIKMCPPCAHIYYSLFVLQKCDRTAVTP